MFNVKHRCYVMACLIHIILYIYYVILYRKTRCNLVCAANWLCVLQQFIWHILEINNHCMTPSLGLPKSKYTKVYVATLSSISVIYAENCGENLPVSSLFAVRFETWRSGFMIVHATMHIMHVYPLRLFPKRHLMCPCKKTKQKLWDGWLPILVAIFIFHY